MTDTQNEPEPDVVEHEVEHEVETVEVVETTEPDAAEPDDEIER